MNNIWNTVNLRDCIEGLSKMQDNSADCIIIDPPYNIGKDFGNNKTKTEIFQYVEWSKKWITEAERVLAPSGTMFVYGFSEILAFLAVELKLPYRWLTWHYTNKTTPTLNFWQRSHESILCVYKDPKKRIFNRDLVREPYTENYVKGYADGKRKRKNTTGRFSKEGSEETTYKVHEKGALPRDVIKVSALAGGAGLRQRFVYNLENDKLYTKKEAKAKGFQNTISHPTQKPIELTEKLLLSCLEQDKKNTVVIPFCGTGSECYVAQKMGQNWISFEINKDYQMMATALLRDGFPQGDPFT
jgi:site-specific DNA-methyltransferase (adenine-specific)